MSAENPSPVIPENLPPTQSISEMKENPELQDRYVVYAETACDIDSKLTTHGVVLITSEIVSKTDRQDQDRKLHEAMEAGREIELSQDLPKQLALLNWSEPKPPARRLPMRMRFLRPREQSQIDSFMHFG